MSKRENINRAFWDIINYDRKADPNDVMKPIGDIVDRKISEIEALYPKLPVGGIIFPCMVLCDKDAWRIYDKNEKALGYFYDIKLAEAFCKQLNDQKNNDQ